ncbi:signal recognition particle protein [bacterium]|nr:signal recognition particle protein [bacterium]
MFDDLITKLDGAIRKIRGTGKLNEKNIADAMRDIRRVLLEADVNYRVVKQFIAAVQGKAVGQEVLQSITPGQQIVKIVHEELIYLLGQIHVPIQWRGASPHMIMVVGLQGSGKTTFAGKLAYMLKKQERLPMLVAADVYRPAAIEQLITLGESIDIPVFIGDRKQPLIIAKSSIEEARRQNHDVIILDTAGRLHVDDVMMNELVAIKKAINPSEILFVADGMTGQDAVNSAQAFMDRLDFDGIVLTKLDGDAKGGAALSIRSITGKPIKFIGIGEKLHQLEPFHPDRMASRILGMGDIVTLVEKAQESVDQEKAEKLALKIRKQSFTFEDFLDQLNQVKKMGPISQIMNMLPGTAKLPGNFDVDDHALVKVEAIIHSMTKEERQKPQIINGSRRKRIARGSGSTVQDVNRLLRQFQSMRKMMKQMSRMQGKGVPKGFPMDFS